MRNFHPSCRLTCGEVELTNPTEGEMLTQLRATAGSASPALLLERGSGENLQAVAGSEPGLLRLSKDKGPGRGVFAARGEVPLPVAERVFAAYLSGDADFDRGLKWQPMGWSQLAKAVLWAALVVAAGLLALAMALSAA